MNSMNKVEKVPLNVIWNLKNKVKSVNVIAQVPGTVFETLIENNIIQDPFYGEREREMSWIFDSDWVYETEFDVSEDFLEHSNMILRFHGLDTISEVYLNDKLLGSAENMFITHDFKVNSLLKNESNLLKIKFESPTKKAHEDIKKHGDNLNTGQDGIPGIPYLRKAQYSFD